MFSSITNNRSETGKSFLKRKETFFQPKLTISQPNDGFEQEAGAMADKVMRMPDTSSGRGPFFKPVANAVQRKCRQCEEEDKHVHRKESDAGEVRGSNELDNYVNSLNSSGRPMPESSRRFFEPKFGHDFSNVRLHTDSEAAKSAQSINALAYTSGNNIVFNSGQYSPESDGGKRLMAHELTHVLQQKNTDTVRRTCSATMTCCDFDRCNTPDNQSQTALPASTWWALDVNVDIEASSWEAAVEDRMRTVGHTFVRFYESNGNRFTYGFYPAQGVPNQNQPNVPGCVNHPDTSHDACTDRTETFFLTLAQYNAGLAYARNICDRGHYYGYSSVAGSYTCTTFAAGVVSAAGHHMPSSASVPMEFHSIAIPSIDNPNTLNENMQHPFVGLGGVDEIRNAVEIWGPATLSHYSWEQKVRWIRSLLDATWIQEANILAVVKICCLGTSAADLANIRTQITPMLNNISRSTTRTTVTNALAGICH